MEYICGMTYAPFARKGSYQEKRAFDSLKKMKENTNSNFVSVIYHIVVICSRTRHSRKRFVILLRQRCQMMN